MHTITTHIISEWRRRKKKKHAKVRTNKIPDKTEREEVFASLFARWKKKCNHLIAIKVNE